MIRVLLAALLLLPAVVHAESARCIGAAVATLPLLPAGDKSAIPVSLNGLRRNLVLDTGATHLALARNAVRELGLAERDIPHAVLSGIGGLLSHGVVNVDAIGVGGIRFTGVNIPVITVEMPDVEGHPVAGVMGTSVLSHFDVALDFRGQRLSLFQGASCAGIDPIWPGTWARLAMETEPSNLDALLHRVDVESSTTGAGIFHGDPLPNRARLYTVVRVNGQDLIAAVDSGAALSTVTPAAARRLGLPADGPRVQMVGTDLHTIAGYRAAAHLVIGDDDRQARLAVADIDAGRADMLLGHDLMEGRRVLISFSTRQLFWQSARAGDGV